MILPFPLNDQDNADFYAAVGDDWLNSLPAWGGIAVWKGRTILVFPAVDGFRFTDITAGIPDSGVPGGVIPAATLTKNMPTSQTSAFGVFLYSLPSNFYNIAKEDLKQVAGDIASGIQPLIPALSLTTILVVGVLIYMYMPRPRS